MRWDALASQALLAISSLVWITAGEPGGPPPKYIDKKAIEDGLLILSQGSTGNSGPYARSNEKKAHSSSTVSFDPSDLMIVSTLDGTLHGVHKTSGQTMWSTADTWGPLVSVAENPMTFLDREEEAAFKAGQHQQGGKQGDVEDDIDDSWIQPPEGDKVGGEEGYIIPEPVGDGNLYHFLPGSPIKKLPFSIKQAVSGQSFTDGRVVYVPKKVSRLLALDPMSGHIMKSFGQDEPWVFNSPVDPNAVAPIMISRTEYILMITDAQTMKVRWNITFGEYSSSSLPKSLFSPGEGILPPVGGMLIPAGPKNLMEVSSSVDGVLKIAHAHQDVPVSVQFKTPAIAAFDVGKVDEDGVNHQVHKVFPVDFADSSVFDYMQRHLIQKKKEKASAVDVFVGTINNTFYLLSEKYSDIKGIASAPSSPAAVGHHSSKPSLPESHTDNSGSTDLTVVDTSMCVPGSPHYPACIVGSHKMEPPEAIPRPGHAYATSHLGWSLGANKFYVLVKLLFGLDPTNYSEASHHTREHRSYLQVIFVTAISVLAIVLSAWWLQAKSKIELGVVPLKKAKSLSFRQIENEREGLLPDYERDTETPTTVPMHAVRTIDSVESAMVSVDVNKPLPPVAEPNVLADATNRADEISVVSSSTASTSVESPNRKKKKKKKSSSAGKDSNGTPTKTEDSDEEDQENDTLDLNDLARILPNGSDNYTFSSSSQGSTLVDARAGTARAAQDESHLKTIQVTDTILGHGSHGTIVFKGVFENRQVAVKRLLLDFYDIAHHEVKVLRESDHHPNVVRYFYQESTPKFMYIALELCPCSLFDVMENHNSEYHSALRLALKPKNTVQQIIAGIQHLHSLKIVHRDIKPQNILVAESKSKTNPHPRLLISDFGLCKRLAEDQSSFHNTVNSNAGTLGWRAPECMVSAPPSKSETESDASSWVLLSPTANVRVTKAVDIFSAGCVAFYVMTGGHHPFGDRYSREINILKGNHRLDKLDSLDEGPMEAKDLVRRMIAKDNKKRPEATALLMHPYFWTSTKKLAFLQDVSDRFEIEEKDPPSALIKQLERGANKAIGPDWYRKIDRMLLDNLGKYRKYDGASVRDLLRALRNKKHHYQDLPPEVKKSLGDLPEGFLSYFTTRFPNLLLHVYHVVSENKSLRSESMFRPYFESTN
ncbi:bifunctional endoribonuclease/protein kinase ire1 [Chytridiales sp. JEL 0842]|nr:bifunctional endoribonuclease/protein kinase ire1 [Chytridiales sp. JEL 0842]